MSLIDGLKSQTDYLNARRTCVVARSKVNEMRENIELLRKHNDMRRAAVMPVPPAELLVVVLFDVLDKLTAVMLPEHLHESKE